MKSTIVSIIIPVYNVESYLDECINSVLKQNYNYCEIILVDDGSTDSSPMKCDTWSKHFEYISVVHKENGGLSSARNAGLKLAQGEYVLFLDSDDRISEGSLLAIDSAIKESHADLYFLQGIKFYPNGKVERLDQKFDRGKIYKKSKTSVLKYLSSLSKYPGSSCTKAYKLSFLNDNGIRFPSDNRIAEDLGFVLNALLLADSYDVVETDYYEYRQNREGSITNDISKSKKAFWDLALFLEDATNQLTIENRPKQPFCRYALSLVSYELLVALLSYSRISGDKRKESDFLNNYIWLLDYSRFFKGRLLRLLIKLLGIDYTSSIISYVYNTRERLLM